MTSVKVHMSTTNSSNGSKRKNQGNLTSNAQSNKEPKHD